MKKSKEHNHPEINDQDTFLCLIDGKYFCGRFSKVWFGWSFDDWYGGPIQFDAPGTNSSAWQQVWIINGEKTHRVRRKSERCTQHGCKGFLSSLETAVGDPEGIRNDLQCNKCGTYFGMSSSSLFKLDGDQIAEIEE